MYLLENELARATVLGRGAELSSFQRKDFQNLEYIWPADPAVWGRHAPVLFPIVGRLPEHQYQHAGHTYHLGQHGFARDQDFQLIHHSPTELVLELTDQPATRAVYPFAFALRIRYQLAGATLTIGWEVHNPAATELLFSIGAHPAFRCPLLPDERFEDYQFEFDHPVTAARYLLQDGLLTGESEPLLQEQTVLPLTYELFSRDALVLKQFDFTRLRLRSRRSGRGVEARFDGFPYLGLWTKEAGAPFVCIEPWQGIASSTTSSGQLVDKEGILTVAGGHTYSTAYHLTFV